MIRECFATVREGDETEGRRVGPADVPDKLVQRLIRIFASDEGYALYPDVTSFFERLNRLKYSGTMRGRVAGRKEEFDSIVVGILSNSDDRVAPILTSLGLQVGSAWADDGQLLSPMGAATKGTVRYDIDFIVTSYEAGHEKPNRAIYEVAEKRAMEHLLATTLGGSHVADRGSWSHVHIGDEYGQDYRGAVEAGWDSYLLLRRDETANSQKNQGMPPDVKQIHTLDELFPQLGLNKP